MKPEGDACSGRLRPVLARYRASWPAPHPRPLRSPMLTLEEVRARFARDLGLPCAASLTESCILDALNELPNNHPMITVARPGVST